MITKICARCKQQFEVNTNKGGRKHCSSCQKALKRRSRLDGYWKRGGREREKKYYAEYVKRPGWKEERAEYAHRLYEKIKLDPVRAANKRRNTNAAYSKRMRNPEYRKKAHDYRVLWMRRRMQETRKKLLEVYGRECACCGEKNEAFLTLDHVRNDGQLERRRLSSSFRIYKKAIEASDKSQYQILCYNCNLGKASNGGICPHKAPCPYRVHYGRKRDDLGVAK